MTEQGSRKERVIVSPSLLSWNPSDYVYHPEFDLGIGEEWLPKHPVARVSTSIDVLNQDESSNDDDAQFWQSIGAIEDSKLIEVIAEQPVSATQEEVPSAPEPKRSKTGPLPQSEACRLDSKPTKLLLSLKKPHRHCHQESNAPLNDSTNSSAPLQPSLARPTLIQISVWSNDQCGFVSYTPRFSWHENQP